MSESAENEIAPPRPRWIRRLARAGFRVALVALLLAALAIGGGLLWVDRTIVQSLPTDLSAYRTWRPPTVCRIVDARGQEIDRFYVDRRIWVPLAELPEHVGQAFVASEDRDFWKHSGVSVGGILRAFAANARAGHTIQGGSTITQQLVKNLLVGKERSYQRKFKEAVLARRLERHLSKNELLELYINYVALGSGNYGVEAAAKDYFGISARELDAGQAAMLAGLVPAPSRYSPRHDPAAAARRRELALRRMVAEGFVDPAEAVRFLDAPVLIPRPSTQRTDDPASAYVTSVRREVRRLLGDVIPFAEGLAIHTPYDEQLQTTVRDATREAVAAWMVRQEIEGPLEGAVADVAAVVLENATGRVLAISGGKQTGLEGFVRATQARRQPGSSFKPYVYAAALAAGHSQLDTMIDGPLSLPAGGGKWWTPGNYGNSYGGAMTLRHALAKSVNTVAVRLLLEQGSAEIVRTARAMGVRTPLRSDPTIALGSSEVTPMDQALGYATIARGGVPTDPVWIDRIVDVRGLEVGHAGGPVTIGGRVVATLPGGPKPRALQPGVAYELADMMREVVRAGTAVRAKKPGFDRMGKTGTTNGFVDAWFVGFTPRHTIAVWVGSDGTGTLGDKETGGKAALPAWVTIAEALPDVEGERLAIPPQALLLPVDGAWVGLRRDAVPPAQLPRTAVTAAPLTAW
jgi:penicillin-binding protein 1A